MSDRATERRSLAAALVAVAASFIYFVLFRDYGFQIEDEGTLLFQLSRVVEGQLPYSDFHTGYTPGFFHGGAWLLAAVGDNVQVLRLWLALMNALTTGALALVATRLLPPRSSRLWALLPALAWVCSLPVFEGSFASFNIPYPAWPAAAVWAALAVLLTGSRFSLSTWVVAGLLSGVAFAIKPNAGAFAMAGSIWCAALVCRRSGAWEHRLMQSAVWLMAGGVWFALGLAVFTVDAVVHMTPVLALAFVCSRGPRARFELGAASPALSALAALAAGFALPTAVWAVPVLGRLGLERFLREVLLLGSGAAELYYTAHPPVEPFAALVVAAALGIAVIGRAVSRGLSPQLPATAAVVAALLAGVFVVLFSTAPEGVAASVGWQMENASFWLAPLVNCAGVLWLARASRAGGSQRMVPLAMVAVLSVCMYLQIFPRSDFMHLAISVPLTAVIASVLLKRCVDWWAAGDWENPVTSGARLGAVVCVVALAIAGARTAPALAGVFLHSGELVLDTPRVRAGLGPDVRDDLEAFAMTVAFIRDRTRAGEAVLTFPALTGVLYAAERTSPVPHDYWYPGRPDHDDEAAMLDELEASPPRYVVTLNTAWGFFIGSPEYFEATRDFVRSHYSPAARFGRFDILAHNSVAVGEVLYWQPSGTAAEVGRPLLSRRRQAAQRWLAGLRPADIAGAALPEDRVAALLTVRAVRDMLDIRGAAWVLLALERGDERLYREACDVLQLLGRHYQSPRSGWGEPAGGRDLTPYLAPLETKARALLTSSEPRLREFASTLLSIIGATPELPL